MDFKQYLQEAVDKTAVMAFGRFNPPTVGHEKLIQKVKAEADERGASGHVFASHSQLTRKDPLPQASKIGYLNQIAHGTEIHGSSKEQPTFLHAAAKLYSAGHKHLVMIAGSDRVQEYQEKLDKYNDGKDYPHGKFKFKSIKVVSAGQRDPDAEGVEGMSGTKMRELARGNKHKQFEGGLPEALKDKSKEIGNHVRAIKDEVKEDVLPSNEEMIREAYIRNEIYKLGDVVEAMNGDKGPIVFRGTTYVTIQLAEGKTVKHWLRNVQIETKVWPEIIIRPAKKIYEKKIPALLMSPEQLVERSENSMELEYGGYNTKFLHMCPGASSQLKELITIKDLNPKFVLQAIMATDQYLEIEKQSEAAGFANEHQIHDFNMKLAIAHDTLNMLGYPDASLTYMTNHIRKMSELNLHKDTTYANEVSATVPTQGAGEVEEGFNASDYKIKIEPDGKQVKVRSKRIVTDTMQVKETITMSKLRRKIGEAVLGDPEQEEETVHRDVNRTGDKEVFHGVDATHSGIGHEGKPVGLVSFKSYMSTPETKKIESDKSDAMQDVHRAKAELSVHSHAYKLMKKAQQLDN